MKVPLTFQITEFDCGTTTLLNALLFLYEREEIPVSLLKAIYKYTLDAKGEHGVIGEAGTSRNALSNLTSWIHNYADNNHFGISFTNLEKEQVTKDVIQECLDSNGCVLARCYQDVEHYILITKMDDVFTYIFDPYYVDEEYYVHDEDVAVILNQPFTHNRLVKTNRLFSQAYADFSLMEIDKREIILINRI